MKTKSFVTPFLCCALILLSGASLVAQGVLSVMSTNDGQGQFSWTLSSSAGIYLDHFKMKLYGVQEAFSPQGWSAIIEPDDYVTWSGAPAFNGSPMTLSIRSSSTQAISYGGTGNVTYPDGLSWGDLVFVRFAYEGPVQVPEPAPSSLCVVAFAIGYFGRRRVR